MTSVQISSASMLPPTGPVAGTNGPVAATSRESAAAPSAATDDQAARPRQPRQGTETAGPASDTEPLVGSDGRLPKDSKADGDSTTSRPEQAKRSNQPAKAPKGQAAGKTAATTAAPAESPFAAIVRRLAAQDGGSNASPTGETAAKTLALKVQARAAAAEAPLLVAKQASAAKPGAKVDAAAAKLANATTLDKNAQAQTKVTSQGESAGKVGKAVDTQAGASRPTPTAKTDSVGQPGQAARTAGQTAQSSGRSDRTAAGESLAGKPAAGAPEAMSQARAAMAQPPAGANAGRSAQKQPQANAGGTVQNVAARWQPIGQSTAAQADASAGKSAAAHAAQAKLIANAPAPPAHQPNAADALRAVEGVQMQMTSPDSAGAAQAARAGVADAAQGPDRPVVDQIIESIQAGAIEAGRQLVVRLNPPELGQVRLTLEADGAGVRGVVEVDNPRTLAEIQRETAALTDRLADSGVELRRLDVQLSDSGRDAMADSALHQGPDGRGGPGGQAAQDSRDGGADGGAPRGDELRPASSEAALPGGLAADQTINVWI